VPVLFLVSLATFFLIELVPGDPVVASLGNAATPETVARARESLGLDRPVATRYVEWLGDAVTGDLGNSLIRPSASVSDLVRASLPITLQLAFMGLLIALVVAIPLAIWAAYREGTGFDRATNVATAAIISVPSFLAALLLAYFFVFEEQVPRTGFLAVGLGIAAALFIGAWRRYGDDTNRAVVSRALAGLAVVVVTFAVYGSFPEFPRTGFSRLTDDRGLAQNLRTAFLPAFTLALTEIAVFTRLLRTDMIATLQEDYILAAKAKGMPLWRVLWGDALRPSSFSLITLAGVSLGRLIGGTVIVETVFGIPGMGRLVVTNGVVLGDYPIVQGGVLVIAVFYVMINLLVDMSYLYLDPRIRRG
jgi:peptide/nickel transport system permease protein